MRYKLVSAALLLLFASACPVAGGQLGPSLEQALEGIRKNIAELEAAIPDFVSDERVTSSRRVEEKLEREAVTDSLFTCVKKVSGSRTQFLETRRVTAIDGKPVSSGSKPKGPVTIFGGFSGLLRGTFDPKNVPFQEFSSAGTERLEGRPVLIVQFATKQEQTGMGITLNGRMHRSNDTGTAWVEPESLQVVRIERKYAPVAAPYEIVVRTDYAPMMIDGRSFWMPKTVVSTWSKARSKKPTRLEYTAEYKNYRKFSVSSDITYTNQ